MWLSYFAYIILAALLQKVRLDLLHVHSQLIIPCMYDKY